jgi:hypothetical protein
VGRAREIAKHGADVAKQQRGERETGGRGDKGAIAVTDREHLAVLGADVGVADRFAVAASSEPSPASKAQPRRSVDID